MQTGRTKDNRRQGTGTRHDLGNIGQQEAGAREPTGRGREAGAGQDPEDMHAQGSSRKRCGDAGGVSFYRLYNVAIAGKCQKVRINWRGFSDPAQDPGTRQQKTRLRQHATARNYSTRQQDKAARRCYYSTDPGGMEVIL